MERLGGENAEQETEAIRPKTLCDRCGKSVTGLVLAGVPIPLRYCPPCSDDVVVEEQAREHAVALEQALDRAGATPRIREFTIKSHPDDAARAVALDWLARYRSGAKPNLCLYGPVGTRKTGLAWGIVRELTVAAVDEFFDLDEEYRPAAPRGRALFLVWRDLYDDLVASFDAQRRSQANGDDADPSFLLASARRVPVLVLDDLGAGRPPTPFALEQLEILIDRRYQAMLPTIVTSNATTTRELAARLGHEDPIAGKRIASRLVEGAIRHVFEGENVRRPAA